MAAKSVFEPPLLGAREVHLWWACVPEGNSFRGDGPAALAPAERARAARFRLPHLRRRYAFRRRVLRRLLGGYAGVRPDELRFGEGEHRKPLLDPDQAGELRFNVSVSEDHVLLGVTRAREVGVDVETLERRGDFEGVARRVFTARELASLEGLGGQGSPAWRAAFLRGWTRKEAFLKAYGTGLLREPRDLHVGLEERAPGPPWSPDDSALGAWGRIADLEAPAGFAAAVSAQGDDWCVVVRGRIEPGD